MMLLSVAVMMVEVITEEMIAGLFISMHDASAPLSCHI